MNQVDPRALLLPVYHTAFPGSVQRNQTGATWSRRHLSPDALIVSPISLRTLRWTSHKSFKSWGKEAVEISEARPCFLCTEGGEWAPPGQAGAKLGTGSCILLALLCRGTDPRKTLHQTKDQQEEKGCLDPSSSAQPMDSQRPQPSSHLGSRFPCPK